MEKQKTYTIQRPVRFFVSYKNQKREEIFNEGLIVVSTSDSSTIITWNGPGKDSMIIALPAGMQYTLEEIKA